MRKIDETGTPVANIPPFGLRLQPGLKRRVEEAAKANGRSINAEIAARLEATFSSSIAEAENLGERVKLLERDHKTLERELETLRLQIRRVESELSPSK